MFCQVCINPDRVFPGGVLHWLTIYGKFHQNTKGKIGRKMKINGPAHETLIVVVYAHKPPLDIHVDLSIGARSLKFDLSLHLHLHSYLVCASSESSHESVHLRRLT